MPLKVSGSTFQSGARSGAATRSATQTATPMTGNSVEQLRGSAG